MRYMDTTKTEKLRIHLGVGGKHIKAYKNGKVKMLVFLRGVGWISSGICNNIDDAFHLVRKDILDEIKYRGRHKLLQILLKLCTEKAIYYLSPKSSNGRHSESVRFYESFEWNIQMRGREIYFNDMLIKSIKNIEDLAEMKEIRDTIWDNYLGNELCDSILECLELWGY